MTDFLYSYVHFPLTTPKNINSARPVPNQLLFGVRFISGKNDFALGPTVRFEFSNIPFSRQEIVPTKGQEDLSRRDDRTQPGLTPGTDPRNGLAQGEREFGSARRKVTSAQSPMKPFRRPFRAGPFSLRNQGLRSLAESCHPFGINPLIPPGQKHLAASPRKETVSLNLERLLQIPTDLYSGVTATGASNRSKPLIR
jgi:hypothetical protein